MANTYFFATGHLRHEKRRAAVMERVFITGQTMVSPAGDDSESHREALLKERLAFSLVGGLPVGRLTPYLQKRICDMTMSGETRRHDPATCLGVWAAKALLSKQGSFDPDWACVVGSSRGATQTLERAVAGYVETGSVAARTSPVTTANVLPSMIAKQLGLRGPHFYVSAACSTGLHALGISYGLIKSGIFSGAIAGGVEYASSPFTLKILREARVYSQITDPKDWPHRPFHPERSGMVLADGAGLLCLENRPNRESIEILAYAAASEAAGLTGVSPDGEALQRAIQQALAKAEIDPQDIDGIVGHGAGTLKGDQAEMNCYELSFGQKMPPILFHKWLTGHSLGAAGSLSVAWALHHMASNSIGTHPYLPELDKVNVQRFRGQMDTMLVVTLGFGGNAAAMILRKT